jgi:hypothetical protein
MSASVDLYGTAYGNFGTRALEQVRRDTYGEDFGQSSWVTAEEYRRFFRLLNLTAADHVLDVGCGSGGPAMFIGREVGCREAKRTAARAISESDDAAAGKARSRAFDFEC